MLLNYCIQEIVIVPGATAQGMVNPNTKTNALRIFHESLSKFPHDQTVTLLLGEVDTGFVVWYYAEKFKTSIDEQLNRSLVNYFTFIDDIMEFHKVIILSAPLPTIKDNQHWGNIANLRNCINATQKDRTELTMRYNDRLSAFCHERNIMFIDTSPILIDPKTGVLDGAYLNPDPLDHHIEEEKYAAIIAAQINNMGVLEKG